MRVLLGVGLMIAATGCAANEDGRGGRYAARGDQCFSAASVNSFNPVGRDAVDVRVSASRVYRLELGAGCFDVDWAQRVALRSRTGNFICGAADAELIVPSVGGRGADRCTVTSVRRLGPAEIEASRRRN